MKIKFLFGVLFIGILVLAVGGLTVRRSRRAVRVVIRPGVQTAPQAVRAPARRPAFA